MKKQITELMQISDVSYYRWKKSPKQKDKKEAPKIFSLLEKYFTEDDLQEFLETGQVTKYDNQTPSRIKKLEEIINIELLNRIERLEQQVKELQK